jgi:hypothetical protein
MHEPSSTHLLCKKSPGRSHSVRHEKVSAAEPTNYDPWDRSIATESCRVYQFDFY